MSISGIRSYLPTFLGGIPTPEGNIFRACAEGDLKAVEALVKGGTNLKKPNEMGLLPIHYAAASGKAEIVKFLIEKGSAVDEVTNSVPPQTPLSLACMYQQHETAAILLKNGARPNQLLYGGMTPILHTLTEAKDLRCADILIKYGALLGSKDIQGRTPLHNAKDPRVSLWLMNKGSPSDAKDNKGLTPKDVALSRESDTVQNYNNAYILSQSFAPWQKVQVQERNAQLKLESPKEYLIDKKTADLYRIEESSLYLRGKALIVMTASLPFALIPILNNLIQIISDVVLTIWKNIIAFSTKEIIASLKNIAISIIWDSPVAILNRIYRATCAPLFAIAMLFVGLYTFYLPLEGRKLLNQMEEKWDESGLLYLAGMKKVGNLATSESNGYAQFYLN